MPGRHIGDAEGAEIEFAAVVHLLVAVPRNALPDQVVADLRIGDEHGAGRLADLDRRADVVVVAVGDDHMGRALRRHLFVALEGRVVEERVDHEGPRP